MCLCGRFAWGARLLCFSPKPTPPRFYPISVMSLPTLVSSDQLDPTHHATPARRQGPRPATPRISNSPGQRKPNDRLLALLSFVSPLSLRSPLALAILCTIYSPPSPFLPGCVVKSSLWREIVPFWLYPSSSPAPSSLVSPSPLWLPGCVRGLSLSSSSPSLWPMVVTSLFPFPIFLSFCSSGFLSFFVGLFLSLFSGSGSQ